MYRDIKDVRFELTHPTLSVWFTASLWGEGRRDYRTILTLGHPFACCGIRSMSGMDTFKLVPQLQTEEYLKKLVVILKRVHRGHNISFVLSPIQKDRLQDMLKNMNAIGRGIQEIPFHNFNMRRPNYMYVWTYAGRKPAKKKVETLDPQVLMLGETQ